MTVAPLAGSGAMPSDADSVAEALAAMADAAGIARHGVTITDLRVVGSGSRASVDLALSNGETITFESVRELANARMLGIALTMAVGEPCAPNAKDALRVVALLKTAGSKIQTTTDDDIAREWGLDFLQRASSDDVNMQDRAARWAAFSNQMRRDAVECARASGLAVAAASVVFVDEGGTRYARTGWFYAHARQLDPKAGSNADIASRMERVGWQRRGRSGRIKATPERGGEQLVFAFFVIPPGWENGS